ncbi:MAG: hypothetical protein MUD16_09420 [Desulfobacterales bacterium]|jgi:hypothetical protein|nr:hypothetical protein [Desulfobacterales bacterium]
MWLIAGALLAALVIWAVVRRKAKPAKRPADAPEPYVCNVCDDRHCDCEKPGRQPPAQ